MIALGYPVCDGAAVDVAVAVAVEVVVVGKGPVQNLLKKAGPLSTPEKSPNTTATFIVDLVVPLANDIVVFGPWYCPVLNEPRKVTPVAMRDWLGKRAFHLVSAS